MNFNYVKILTCIYMLNYNGIICFYRTCNNIIIIIFIVERNMQLHNTSEFK